ncbi:hypothetical protein QMG83_14520 [Salinibacterium sp. G-O1]|uniref:hypothetical protein n=1 Tax=Salinibacterium sp. G-O1 TaxID=3046208 RepID=UPI0024BBE86A|nr:hypothetical protein [Salinibacterium sp. G-O1]MDJ0336438.1 hypothetical protein [Salinibacterium sp. G-O1]
MQTKVLGTPEWTRELAQQASTRLEHRVIVGTARVNASNQNVQLAAAGTGRVRRGVKAVDLAAPVEFGANRNQVKTYRRRSKNGGTHEVTRHTSNQLRWRKRTGHVFYPATARFVPRIASLWAQTVVRTIAFAFEGRT